MCPQEWQLSDNQMASGDRVEMAAAVGTTQRFELMLSDSLAGASVRAADAA